MRSCGLRQMSEEPKRSRPRRCNRDPTCLIRRSCATHLIRSRAGSVSMETHGRALQEAGGDLGDTLAVPLIRP